MKDVKDLVDIADAAVSRDIREIRSSIYRNASQTANDAQQAIAEQLAIATLRSYWENTQRRHKGNLAFPKPPKNKAPVLNKELENLLSEFGAELSELPIEKAAFEVGQLYTHALPTEYRAKQGIYYTPPLLANRLLDKAEKAGIRWSKAHVLDPACGGGAFLIPIAMRLIKEMQGVDPALIVRNLQTRIEGWDMDPFACWLSNTFINIAATKEIISTGVPVKPTVRNINSLQCKKREYNRFDLVVGNPPFGKVRLEPKIRERYSRSLYGHANLYGVFTDLAVSLAKPNGVVAFLTPASFLAGEYFKALRSLLWREAPPISLDFVESRKGVFDGVLQETILATYRKGGKRSDTNSYVVHPDTTGLQIAKSGVFKLPTRKPTAPWIIARRKDDEALINTTQNFHSRLSDWGYRVSTGPLVWNRHKEQLTKRKSSKTIPIIWSESVTTDGEFIFRSEKKNHQPYFIIKSPKDKWLQVDKPCVLLQRTTAKEQHKRLIAAELPTDFIDEHISVSVENHLNMIYPTQEKPAVSIKVLTAFINSSAADRIFRCLSGSVAVSAYELESLPLPDKNMLAKLKKIVAANASKEAIEHECSALYKLNS